MATFYPGQTDYIDRLNDLASVSGVTGIVSYTASTSIGGHLAITINSSGEAILASSNIASNRVVTGITLNSATTGGTLQTVYTGPLEHLGWSFTPGGVIYLGLSGALTQTLPGSAVFSKVLGVAITATRINIDFQPTIFL